MYVGKLLHLLYDHAENISRVSDVEIIETVEVLPKRFGKIIKNLKNTDYNPGSYLNIKNKY